MYEIEASAAAFNAEQTFVGWSVCSLCIHNLSVFYEEIILAACCTMRTGSQNLLVNLIWTIFLSALHGQSACRTGLNTVTAGFTDTFIPFMFIMCTDHRLETTIHCIDCTSSYDFLTGIHTAMAENTKAWIIGKKFISIINRHILHFTRIACLSYTIFKTVVL